MEYQSWNVIGCQKICRKQISPFLEHKGCFLDDTPIFCESAKTRYLQPAKQGNIMGCHQKGINWIQGLRLGKGCQDVIRMMLSGCPLFCGRVCVVCWFWWAQCPKVPTDGAGCSIDKLISKWLWFLAGSLRNLLKSIVAHF